MSLNRRHPYVHLHSDWRRITRAELLADGIVHAIGIVLAITAGAVLLWLAAGRTAVAEYVATIFYVVSLLTVLSVSCAYNLWPASRAKWILRRFDHSAIYLLIAGTYTPLLTQLDGPLAGIMLAVVWGAALTGIAFKLVFPGRYDRVAIGFYLAIGWSGIAIAGELARIVPQSTFWYIAAGGICYSAGVIFFVWRNLRFQSAVWHGFVVSGAGLHLAAMMDLLVIHRL
ncbi:hemolysin III family protein [Aquibium sp. ELW1220]|jgi:hemolysin III|uniref:PAQR family membrane homeostasis protein TrhA n=1 Tax=Aquibium sp. ELW1220 TaxID=2976766 RepID=UPI0025B083B2|nr:hemolysin III family protein [Aquibium sp. ELW1220]MDN2580051.1 hemolysin III family protein [Aquibium sp. ELW1220]